jgi:hypothetical protein
MTKGQGRSGNATLRQEQIRRGIEGSVAGRICYESFSYVDFPTAAEQPA